jgi:hypothetical protein
MIQITNGNPTPEEIAALVAVLALASATTQPGPIGSTAAGWRRSAPFAQLNPAELGRRDRRWRRWSAGWPRVGPPHGSQLSRQGHFECKHAHLGCWRSAVGFS